MPKPIRKSKSSRVTIKIEPGTFTQMERQRRVLEALSLKRRHPELSMSEVAHRSGTTLKTIRKYGASALQKRSGRLDVKATDTIRRPIQMLTDQGYVDILVTSRDASRIARHHNGIRKFVIYGDSSDLSRFERKTVRSGGKIYTFATDKTTINRFARAGALTFQDIYSSVGGA